MVVRKMYNVKQLAVELQRKVFESKKNNAGIVKIDILTACSILDILQETYKREDKNQTLESALTFISKEDGTHTNLMKEENKPHCFGILKNNDEWVMCKECPYVEQCKGATEYE